MKQKQHIVISFSKCMIHFGSKRSRAGFDERTSHFFCLEFVIMFRINDYIGDKTILEVFFSPLLLENNICIKEDTSPWPLFVFQLVFIRCG